MMGVPSPMGMNKPGHGHLVTARPTLGPLINIKVGKYTYAAVLAVGAVGTVGTILRPRREVKC